MSKNLKSLKGLKGSETNPFIVELKGKMYLQPRANTIIAKGQGVVDTNTGEMVSEGDVLIGRRKIVDKSQFAKIYASEVSVLFGLSKAALNVFIHLTKMMDYDNKALFDYMKEYEKVGYKTEVSPLKGLRELITKGIIYPHTINGIWWLNPTIVCKGERFAVYTEYVTNERNEKDLQKKAEKQISSQIEEKMINLDPHTKDAMNAMYNAAEEKYIKEEQERIQREELKELQEKFDNA